MHRPGLCAGDFARSKIAVARQSLAHKQKSSPRVVHQQHQMERLQQASDAPLPLAELPRPERPSHLSVGWSAAREMCLAPPRPWPANRELQPHAAGRNAAANRVIVSVSYLVCELPSQCHPQKMTTDFAQLAGVLVNKPRGNALQHQSGFEHRSAIRDTQHFKVVTSESPGSAPKAPAEHWALR